MCMNVLLCREEFGRKDGDLTYDFLCLKLLCTESVDLDSHIVPLVNLKRFAISASIKDEQVNFRKTRIQNSVDARAAVHEKTNC